MLPSLQTPPMQGCAFRGLRPGRLSSGVYPAVSRRASWSGVWRCSADGDASTSGFVSPPIQPGGQLTEPRNVPILSPLPSSQNDSFGYERRDARSFNGRFKSVGSRSEPSLSSIPGKYSKYSKTISRLYSERPVVEVRRDKKAFRKPMGDIASRPDPKACTGDSSPRIEKVRSQSPPVDKIPEWMETYQFSYSETPSAPILGFRQPPWSPFGPEDLVARPWTGCAPLQPSKKKLPEFDSFNPPPIGKKGVKYVARPGPFPPGQGPKRGKTREEILGEPLTRLEIDELVTAVNKRPKQLNLGRDGLTHNMLDVIHNHWKRSLCCKIKCKGVPTVDMDNVARVVEEKTGGVIIHRAGGVIFLFRGRNYNFKDRPQIPIMLWKPPDPIYPRLIKIVPEGLTPEEAKRLRSKGRRAAPLCKLAKNGVYLNLVKDVKAQFEIDEVVRVDCQGMNPTDYKKIGAKLKDLVPCTLLSFEKEQIIMCRKKTAVVENDEQGVEGNESTLDASVDSNGSSDTANTGLLVHEKSFDSEEECDEDETFINNSNPEILENLQLSPAFMEFDSLDSATGNADDVIFADIDSENANEVTVGDGDQASSVPPVITREAISLTNGHEDSGVAMGIISGNSVSVSDEITQLASLCNDGPLEAEIPFSDSDSEVPILLFDVAKDGSPQANLVGIQDYPVIADNYGAGVPEDSILPGRSDEGLEEISNGTDIDEVDILWKMAIDDGMALQLDTSTPDPDMVFKKALNQPIIKDEIIEQPVQTKKRAKVPETSPFDQPSLGGLRVDELAKLLAP